jgi:rhomboid protease GluP
VEYPGEGLPEAGIPERVPIRTAAEKARILEDSLVLSSQRIRHWIEFDGERYALTLPLRDVARAVETLRQYEQENRGYGGPAPEDSLDLHLSPLIHLALPAGVYLWADSRPWSAWIKGRAASNAGELLDGEWWRAVTATTLHADIEHLLGNLLSGFFIFNLLRRRIGPGTWMPVLTAMAALTNVLTALISDPGRTSLGFSTVVFAGLGLLAGLETLHLPKGKRPGLRGLSPLFAAFFLAVMMGLGENADIKAHFIGFGTGALAALPVFFYGKFVPLHRLRQAAGVLATFAAYAACWWLALR